MRLKSSIWNQVVQQADRMRAYGRDCRTYKADADTGFSSQLLRTEYIDEIWQVARFSEPQKT